jgi:hypothetical protein
VNDSSLERSRALWNRTRLDLRSDEILAQLLERGEIAAWRQLYRLMKDDAVLRRRVAAIVAHVPLPLPRFWLAALASLGESVDFAMPLPEYGEDGV